jgi:hypothetical protein
MRYQLAVQKNFEHMGTMASEWAAVQVTEMRPVNTGNGQMREMPQFSFPVGYQKAPSLYTGECCNLCAKPIKNVYWIQNDTRQWIMPVGSECVTHFGEGESGEVIAKKTKWEQNRELLVETIAMRRSVWDRFKKRVSLSYGTYEIRIWPHSPMERKADQVYKELKKCLGKVTEESDKAAISRWVNKNGDSARNLIQEVRLLIETTA